MSQGAGREAMTEALLDLQHDLAKYLRLPLAYLPADAEPAAVREALRQALRQTRRGPAGTTPALALWQAFTAGAGESLAGLPGYPALEAAVQRALRWDAVVDNAAAELPRQQIEREFAEVGGAIRAMLRELDG